MTGLDSPVRFVLLVCGLLLTAGIGSGVPAVDPPETEESPAKAVRGPTAGSGGFSLATVGSADGAAQLDELFREPSETVGEPELAVALADPVVEPGTETTVELTIVNTGQIEAGATLDEATATARGLTVTVDDEDAPVEVDSETAAIGSLPPGESVTVPLSVTAPA